MYDVVGEVVFIGGDEDFGVGDCVVVIGVWFGFGFE